MSDANKSAVSPLANLLSGNVFDKRYLQTTLEHVVSAVTKLNPEVGMAIHEGQGYSLIIEPVTLAMVKASQQNINNPNPQVEYHPRHGNFQQMMMGGGFGAVAVCSNFGIIPNGSDRVLIIQATNTLQFGPGQPPLQQMTAIQFDLTISALNGENTTDNKGFVAE